MISTDIWLDWHKATRVGFPVKSNLITVTMEYVIILLNNTSWRIVFLDIYWHLLRLAQSHKIVLTLDRLKHFSLVLRSFWISLVQIQTCGAPSRIDPLQEKRSCRQNLFLKVYRPDNGTTEGGVEFMPLARLRDWFKFCRFLLILSL